MEQQVKAPRRNEMLKGSLLYVKLVIILALSSAILFSQPDIGAFLVLLLTFITIFFISGTQKKQALLYVAVPLVMLSAVLFHQYAVSSSSARLNARSFLQNVNKQKSEDASRNGTLLMAGRGEIYQKDDPHARMGYLPDVQYDYIVKILQKEFGIIGVGLLCLLCMILFYQGVVVYRQLSDADAFARLLCAGILSLLFYQIAVNILCATYILPNMSTYFPFISPFDASSVVFVFIEVGILMGLCKDCEGKPVRNKMSYRLFPGT